MKTVLLILVFLVFLGYSSSFAQIAEGGLSYMGSDSNLLYGGIGLTTIDSDAGTQTYFNVHLRPEFAFGKLGIGLNINFSIL